MTCRYIHTYMHIHTCTSIHIYTHKFSNTQHEPSLLPKTKSMIRYLHVLHLLVLNDHVLSRHNQCCACLWKTARAVDGLGFLHPAEELLKGNASNFPFNFFPPCNHQALLPADFLFKQFT